MSLTPAQRSLRARAAAHSRWAGEQDRQQATRPAKDGFMEKFRRQVDPDGLLDPAERERRARSAMSAHMASLALKSSRKRTA